MTRKTTLGDLVPDPANRRKHNPRNLAMVTEALREVGAARSIVIDEDNTVLAGNDVAEAAVAAGLSRVRVVEADGSELIAVRRRGLTSEQKRALAIYDNRTAELAEWNFEQLAADQAAGLSLQPFWTDDEEATLFPEALKQGKTDPDDVPPKRPTGIVGGDLFELGVHRLLCGDATTQGDVARLLADVTPSLMVTDPPYGVEYDPDWRNEAAEKGLISHAARRVGNVTNDDRIDWTPAWQLSPSAICYCWHADRHASSVQASLESAGFVIRSQIVWAKPRFAISRGDYHWQHEPCWYAVRKGATAQWRGDRSQTTLWSVALDPNVAGGHSTQKPVELVLRPLRNHSGDVYDPFLGSGTALIAAEQVNRACYAIEIEPVYCQVAIDRWEAFTGQRAVKVGGAVCGA
jgi:DNA modification methylase